MQEDFAALSGNVANAITEAFKWFEADLKISYYDRNQEEDLLGSDHECKPRKKEAGRRE